jgi:hypothetical protein
MWGGRVPEAARDRGDVTARLLRDKPDGDSFPRPPTLCLAASSLNVCRDARCKWVSPARTQPTMNRQDRAVRPQSEDLGRTRQKLFDFDGDAIAADDDRAARHRHVVGEDADLILLRGVELDDGAAAEPQDLVDRHRGSAEHDGDVDRDIIQGRQRGLAGVMGVNSERWCFTMAWLRGR